MERYGCAPDGLMLLAPPVLVITPVHPDDHFVADWNGVADSVEYPEIARRTRMEATVAATVTIGEDGRATAVHIMPDSTSEHFLVDAAREGLLRATYTSEAFDPVTGTRLDPRVGSIDVLVVFRSRLCGTPARF